MFAEEMWSYMDEEVRAAYGRPYFNDVVASRMLINRSGEANLTSVTDALADALVQKYPQERYQPMGLDLFIRVFVAQHFPEWVYDYFFIEFMNKLG
ncbi:(2R,3R)-2,3-butanediol dehydrogenase [Halocaridina rubra]|uniref:(2R,3R)-2,3-butanediol dehydrogenase n=1 Tax=Halocaridina rubra TaxID=373956 RepID=A0AAN9AH02_HALRR